MLILSRKLEEKILIGDNIEIKVLDIENGRVKLGIEAPDDVEIIRGELYQQVEEENINAVRNTMIQELSKIKKNNEKERKK